MLDLGKLDVIFISYDEPRADRSFAELQAACPRARRVHGVKGLDSAYKATARLSSTDHFISIEGDNLNIAPELLEGTLDLPAGTESCIIAFNARNPLNGLIYANGGVKIWPKKLALAMRTHENATSPEAATEFCWDNDWYTVGRVVSEIEVTTTPFQAFRAGFREAIKLVTPDGRTAHETRRPGETLAAALHRHSWEGNIQRLLIWCSIGADVENGLFALYGARLGCAMLHFEDFDQRLINDYGWFRRWWQEVISERLGVGRGDERRLWREIRREGDRLRRGLDLPVAELDAEGSRFFKLTRVSIEPKEGLIRPKRFHPTIAAPPARIGSAPS